VTRSLSVLLGIAGLLALSMGVYALSGRRPDADAERKGAEFAGGTGNFLVHWLMWALAPAESLFLRLGASADLFNFVGLSFGLCAGLLIAAGRLDLGGWAIALGGIADVLDGRVARARGVSSDYGKFIDSTLDRFVEAFVFVGFAFYLRSTAYGSTLAAAALAGSLLVSYARARGETVGVAGPKGLMQRAERLVLTSVVCLFDPPLTARWAWPPGSLIAGALALIAAASFGTAVYRTWAIALALRRDKPGHIG